MMRSNQALTNAIKKQLQHAASEEAKKVSYAHVTLLCCLAL
jgi:hypothetical protein